jgi:putative endopeptidase
VDEVFPPAAKENCKEMVDYIKIAFADRIKNLEWMTDETKEKALEKLSKFNVKIGYPDNWKSYETLAVGENSYIENVYAANQFSLRENLDKLGKPVDKSEWFMSPQTVNAYYSPTFNEIVFPAGILQPPFYNFKADAAVNFGGIGAVIGHEISHGFDDNGSRYDGDGNMKNWWTEEDKNQFEERTGKLVAQYDTYEPLDSVFVNGKFTLGENIGDLGGVAGAYDGLALYLKEKGGSPEIQGFTPEQRFFISWATVWRTKYKEEALRNQVLTDAHSPGMYRATGPLVNIDGFYKAFNIIEGNKMFKPDSERVRIW